MESPERRRGTGQSPSSPHSSHSLQERHKGDRTATLDNVILGHRVKGNIGRKCGRGEAFPGTAFRLLGAGSCQLSCFHLSSSAPRTLLQLQDRTLYPIESVEP